MNDLKQAVCDCIDEMADELLAVSHEIHANPELAFQEVKAHALLTDKVQGHGIAVTRGAYGLDTAFAASFGEKGAKVGILSEYDALPGIGHSCGHNIIASAGLGAALALFKLNGRLPGRVRYLGTPAEEAGGGKELMGVAKAFDGLDAAMMVHPSGIDLTAMPCLAKKEIRITYQGRAAHASAMPEAGVNALDALVTAYQSIAQLRQHIRSNERIHGIFNETGLAPNIVPDRAVGTFYVRAGDGNALATLTTRVCHCFEAAALATGCELNQEISQVDYLEMNNSWPIAKSYQHNAERLGRSFFPLEKMPASASGSTDMGNVSHRVPSIHPMISCAPPSVVIHNPEFAKWARSERGDLAVLDGAKALAMTALDVMTDAALRKQAKSDFEATAKASQQAVAMAYREDGVLLVDAAAAGGCGC